MIKEAYCSKEVAKLLKEKGFDVEKCTIAYYCDCLVDYTMFGYCGDEELIFTPTHQVAMAWLRENYKLHFVIVYNQEYEVSIMTIENNPRCKCRSIVKNTYEEVVEAALKYTLENLI